MRIASRPLLRRLAVLDQMIRAGTYPNAASVAKVLEVHPRTVQRDLDLLRDSLGAPLEFSRAHNGYSYREPSYHLPLLQITQGELVALFLAEQLLRQYRQTPYEKDLRSAFAKLTQSLPDKVSFDLAWLGEALSVTPTVVTHHNLDTFQLLSGAVLEQRQLWLEYWTASRDAVTEREVDPYHLTLINGSWYLIAYCYLRQDVLIFATSRVQCARLTGETFERPSSFRIDEYMQGSFRALRGAGRYRVVLRFRSQVAQRVREKEWHKSQKIEAAGDGGVLVRFEVSDLREVLQWALSWGADCEVVEPGEFREMMKREVAEMGRAYRE